MGSFGDSLKREREKKKIALDQVAVSTKVSTRMLRAIEEEKFDQLPGGIFNKGFVRAYARYLGLDEEKVVADYMAAAGGPGQPQAEDLELRAIAEQKEKENKRKPPLSDNFPWGRVAAFLLLSATAVTVWGWYSRADHGSRGTETQAAAEEKTPANEAMPPVHFQTSSSKGGSAAVVRPGVQENQEPINVVVKANEDSWVTITADGTQVFSGMLVAPQQRVVSASQTVVVKAGNVGGLELSLNGKQLASQGDYGEVRTLTFRSDGLHVETPAKTQDE